MRSLLIKTKENTPTIWSETNFVEYPYFRLGKKNSADKEIKIEIQTAAGKALWHVENPNGLPGVISYEIFTALELLIDRNGISPDGKLYFSFKDIINILGWKNCGGSEYRSIRDAIDKIVDTKIVTDMVLLDKASGEKKYHKNFRLLTGFETVSVEYQDGKNMDISMVTFNSTYVSNRKSGYVTPISSETFFNKLDSALARRLYQFLNRRAFYMAKRGETFAVDCMEIGSLMGVSLRYVSDVHKVFSKAHDSLIQIGFLKNVEIDKKRPKKQRYVYLFNPEFQAQEQLERKSFLLDIKKEDGALLQRLVNYGLTHDKANELIEKNEYGVKMVLEQLDHDQLNEKRIKNPAGFIMKFIADGWIIPEYIEANVKRHKNIPAINLNMNNESDILSTETELKFVEDDISDEEMKEYISQMDNDTLIKMYRQVFEIAKIPATTYLNPESFDYNNPGAIDALSYGRIKMIFEAMVSEKIAKDRTIL